MSDEKYIISYDGECDRLERQSHIFGHDRAFAMVAPEPGMRLLDAGCGSGWVSRMIASRMPDCEVVGVDINPDYVAFARAKAAEAGLDNLSYEVGAVGTLPFEVESFDTIWSLMVLMFLPDRRAALADLIRVLRSGGRLVTAQQGTPLHANAPKDPELEPLLDIFLSRAFPDWQPEFLPHMMQTAGLVDIGVQIETDPLYTFLGAATEAQLRNHLEVVTPGSRRMAEAFGGEAVADEFVQRLLDFTSNPNTTTVTGLWTVSGHKP